MNDRTPFEDDLWALANLRDDQIDTSDVPERIDFLNGTRGRFFDLTARNYDVRAIANWCLERAESEGRSVTSMWLNKIVYFVHEVALREFRTLLTPARVEAWDHGPVFREIYFQFPKEAKAHKLLKFNRASRRREPASESFGSSDLAIFEKAWQRYGHFSASKLREISHRPGSPWSIVWESRGNAPGAQIDVSTIIGLIGQGHGKGKN